MRGVPNPGQPLVRRLGPDDVVVPLLHLERRLHLLISSHYHEIHAVANTRKLPAFGLEQGRP